MEPQEPISISVQQEDLPLEETLPYFSCMDMNPNKK